MMRKALPVWLVSHGERAPRTVGRGWGAWTLEPVFVELDEDS